VHGDDGRDAGGGLEGHPGHALPAGAGKMQRRSTGSAYTMHSSKVCPTDDDEEHAGSGATQLGAAKGGPEHARGGTGKVQASKSHRGDQ